MNKESIMMQLKALADQNGVFFEEDILSRAVELAQFRVFPKGTDITRGFGFDGGMCMDEGMMGYGEHTCMWETVEESTLMLFNVNELKSFIMSNENLKTIWIRLLENGLKYKIYRESSFLTENAAERYLYFRKHYPKLCDRVSQKHIATYLGITPESLSRIRKTMRDE